MAHVINRSKLMRWIWLLMLCPMFCFGQISPGGVLGRVDGQGFDGDVVYVPSFSIPAPNDSLLGYWCEDYGIEADSTIILVNTSNEPVDTIDLLGLDWPITAGYIPLKTAALMDWVGTPTIDTGFWKHNIPPCTVYQNIDYDSTTYFKIEDQVLNADSSELLPKRLTEIAVYSSVTDANNYFDVPALTVGAKWVAQSGNDATGNGSLATPWKTIDKATDVSDGSLVYLKSLFLETGDASLHYVYSAVDHSLRSIGRTRILPTATGYDIRLRYATGGKEISGCIIETPASFTGAAVNSTNGLINRNHITTTGGDAINQLGNKNTTNNVIRGTVAATGRSYYTSATGTTTVSGNLFQATGGTTNLSVILNAATSGALNIKWNKFVTNSDYCINHLATAGPINIVGNDFQPTAVVYFIGVTTDVAKATIRANNFKLLKGGDANNVIYFLNYKTNLPEVLNNTFNNSNGFEGNIIYASNSQLKARNNLISSSDSILTAGEAIGSNVGAAGAIALCDISNNKIIGRRNASYHIVVGSESTNAGDNVIDSILIEKNYIKGRDAFEYTYNQTCHGIFTGFQINPYIRYNYAWGSAYGVIQKGTTATANTLGAIAYNVIRNCNQGIYAKGAQAGKIINNTIFTTDTMTYGISLVDNVGGDEASNWTVENNIIISLGVGNNFMVIDNGTDNTIDYNIYYCPNGTMLFNVGGDNKTWSEWQALGYDEHSIVLTTAQYNALFTSPSTGNFSLRTGSIAIGTGVNLGADYDDGLSSTTNWGTDSQIPTVITKQQSISWDIGAYIH